MTAQIQLNPIKNSAQIQPKLNKSNQNYPAQPRVLTAVMAAAGLPADAGGG
jgi:hypothetical protein